ncbi:hypothetical protein [Allomesorhizobium camelthorni]|uniref:Uncharacterized protein n=1 Tax=Allomesorhizobium camelthorni TaxID=475069 RepID=A0A6G4WC81_9HYPH|nr:hypothetical protein [Mesorhizobium camelthorni]NGO52209.1 hypothetical protein [Mesorhizobium camelthorni]
MARDEHNKKEATVDRGNVDKTEEIDFTQYDDDLDGDGGRSLDINLDQDSRLENDDAIGVKVIGSRPVKVELDTEIDQNGEIDQDEDVDVDAGGGSGGREASVRTQQRLEVDQRIDVDVEVSERDGVVFIEVGVDIEEDIEIESDADINVRDGDRNSLETDIDQDDEIDQNIDVDVEIRDGLDASVDVDIVPLVQALARAAIASAQGKDGDSIDVRLDELAAALGDVQIVVDVSDDLDL